MKIHLIFILHMGVLSAGITKAEPFQNDSYKEEFEGRQLVLRCWKEKGSPQEIEWKKLSEGGEGDKRVALKQMDGSKDYLGEWDGKVTFVDNYGLKIHKLTYPRDEGIFQCTDRSESRVTVRILSNPQDVEINDTWVKDGVNYLNVTQEANTTVACRAKGGKQPSSYRWYIGDRIIAQFSTTALTYRFAKSDDKKTLVCKTSTEVQGSARLNVKYPPSTPAIVRQAADTFDLETIEGEDMTLKCHSDGNPPPAIRWLKSGRVIEEGEEYHVSTVSRADSGSYTCRAYNSIGRAEVHKQLVVKYPPAVSLDYLSEQAQLICTASAGYPQSYNFKQWTHMVNGREIKIQAASQMKGATFSLDLSQASFRSSGDYFCNVTNGVKGMQTSTKRVDVNGAPAFAKQSRQFDATLSKPLMVAVQFWSNPPPTKVEWWGTAGRISPDDQFTMTESTTTVPMEYFQGFVVDMPGYESVLKIAQFENAHAGRYEIRVENRKGLAVYDINIKIDDSMSEVVIIISVVSAVCVAMAVGIVVVLIRISVISCSCNIRKRKQASGPVMPVLDPKRPMHLDIGIGVQVEPCPSQTRQSLSLPLPKEPSLKATEGATDLRYMPMGSPPVTPALPVAGQLPCDLSTYVRASVTQASAPQLREIEEAQYEEVVYQNGLCTTESVNQDDTHNDCTPENKN